MPVVTTRGVGNHESGSERERASERERKRHHEAGVDAGELGSDRLLPREWPVLHTSRERAWVTNTLSGSPTPKGFLN